MEPNSASIDLAQEFVKSVQENARNKHTSGWPKCFEYGLTQDLTANVTWQQGCDDRKPTAKRQDEWHRIDCWAVAFILGIAEKLGQIPPRLKLEVRTLESPLTRLEELRREAFIRRISYLQSGHPEIDIDVYLNGNLMPLYSCAEIISRPSVERVPEDLRDRGDSDKGERLEKDFQTFLFGKGLTKSDDEGRCDRLAILGKDFLKVKGKGWGIEREWPTSVFRERFTEETRILPKGFIDLVTLNTSGYLAIIELKVDDSCLEVIGQLLDYSLYFRSYRDKLEPLVRKKIKWKKEIKYPIHCYVANNQYHKRFNEVSKFYGQGASEFGIKLIKLTLGETQEL